ncbi:YheC/YheD family protein [Polycladomyces abyssicola]
MKLNNLLLKDPGIAPYIPKTVWFTDEALKEMLTTYPTVFVKPNKVIPVTGSLGLKKWTS